MCIVIAICLFVYYVLICTEHQIDNNMKKPEIESFSPLNMPGDLTKNIFISANCNNYCSRKIKELNEHRNTEGRFYVDCHKCGRDKILEDMINNQRTVYLKSNKTPHTPCTHGREKTMSYYNEKFVDSSKIFYHNYNINSAKNTSYTEE